MEGTVGRIVAQMKTSDQDKKAEHCRWILSKRPKSYLQEILQFIHETRHILEGIRNFVEQHPIRKSEGRNRELVKGCNRLFI